MNCRRMGTAISVIWTFLLLISLQRWQPMEKLLPLITVSSRSSVTALCKGVLHPRGKEKPLFCFIRLTPHSNLDWNWWNQTCSVISADYLDRKNIGWHWTWHKPSFQFDVLAGREQKAIQRDSPSRVAANDECSRGKRRWRQEKEKKAIDKLKGSGEIAKWVLLL